ncbi:hypothetical protein AMJ57_02750 [Parcubacteria bacterium SG8_24]|nr:MAG: hypothetical protein AMJ57_02750 [Parcubacteria bacterium SG8_24]
MDDIECEVRSFISEGRYRELISFFNENAEGRGEDEQVTYYYDTAQDLRIQLNRSGSKIWLKEGRLHDRSRKEIEVPCRRDDFGKLQELFTALGHEVEIKWYRKRRNYRWQGIDVALDHTRGYGYIIELERKSSATQASGTVADLERRLRDLGIEPTPREEFTRRYEEYRREWRRLVGDEGPTVMAGPGRRPGPFPIDTDRQVQ